MAEVVIHYRERLRELLERLGMDYLQFAEHVGLHSKTVWQWLEGECETTVSYALRVALRTGYTVDDLVSAAPLGKSFEKPVVMAPAVLPKETGGTAFGRTLVAEAKRRGMSRRRLAELCGQPTSTFHCWVSGRVEPWLYSAAVVARRLDMTIHDMLTGEALKEAA